MTPIITPITANELARTAKVHQRLRETIDQSLGSVFFGPLLQSARNSSLKGSIGHGGHGEDVFRGQLDQILVERAGVASHHDFGEVMFKRFAAVAVAKAEGGRTS